jgi:hypothetical protein
LNEQNLRVKNKKDEIKKKIYDDIEIIIKFVQSDIVNVIQEKFIENIYTKLFKFASGTLIIYYFIK